MEPEKWESEFESCYTILLGLAECEYLCGNTEKATGLFAKARDIATTTEDKVRAYQIELQVVGNASQYKESFRIGAECCAFLGYPILLTPTEEEIMGKVKEAEKIFEKQPISTLHTALPIITGSFP